MRYILNNDYIEEVVFGDVVIECKNKTCTEYTGSIPTGYDSLQEWAIGEEGKLGAWKIENGNLVFDNAKYSELKYIYEEENEDNSYVTHKEIFEMKQELEDINDVNASQYKKETATGNIISIYNAKKVYPKIKITNINPYSFNNITLIATGKNMLVNTAYSQTISGINFYQNSDRSISISGTSTEAIEYNIAGTNLNISPLLCLKKNKNYCLSSNGLTIKMYYYDGINRTEIYSGTGGTILFTDSDKLVTQIVISIANGTTLNTKVSPQLEYGSSASNYEMYNGRKLNIDFSNYVDEAIFAANNLYPSDTLYAKGTSIDEINIDSNNIYGLIDGSIKYIGEGNLGLFDGYNNIYSLENVNLTVTYCIDILDVDDLEFLQGKATTTNKFKILNDGSIEAHNGYFSGEINATSGSFTGEINASSGTFGILEGRGYITYRQSDGSYMRFDSNGLYSYNKTPSSGILGSYPRILMEDSEGKFVKISSAGFLGNQSQRDYLDSPITINDSVGVARAIMGTNVNWFEYVSNIFSDSYLKFKIFGGEACVTTWASDRKLKENIENSTINGIEEIMKIPHYQYDWKGKKYHSDCGYVAQDMEEINPHYVHKIEQRDENYTYQINESTIIPVITKAIQEQQKLIEKLEARISELEGKDK